MRKLSPLWALGLLLAICVFLYAGAVATQEVTLLGEAVVDVYVVALDGVGSSIAKNMSHVVDGALAACRSSSSFASVHRGSIEYAEVAVNVSGTVVTGWQSYRELVETGENIIIVNGHDEVVPIPSGYTKEEWVDKIAEAMLERKVTWVHTGWYPFYYAWGQDVGMQELWGEAGLQRLMMHIGKGDVTCSTSRETDFIDISSGFLERVGHAWTVTEFMRAQRGRQLNGTFFGNSIDMAMWGVADEVVTGAVIRFAAAMDVKNFGFYVHVGTNATYNSYNILADGDYYRVYTGVAAAISTDGWRMVADGAISSAQNEVSRAAAEGRTKGLENATSLIDQANGEYEAGRWADAIISATGAKTAATNATEPTFFDVYGFLLVAITVVGAAVSVGIVWVVRLIRMTHKGDKIDETT